MADGGEPSRVEAPAALRIRVTCRRDPTTGAPILDIDPPHAAGAIWDAAWLRLQLGDTASFALVMGEA